MISGRQTLEEVRRTLREERKRLKEFDKRIEGANERLVSIDAARANHFAALAKVRLGKPGADGVPGVNERDMRIAQMLEERRASRTELESRLTELEATVLRLDEEREALADALGAANDEVDAAEAATQARLEQDPAHRAQREKAQAAERIARHASEKASQSEEERSQKGRAYENDAIFMYLWKRGYGTSNYRAWGLTRWLDRKVARLVDFETARANYSRLVELPVRLREHADAMAVAAEDEIAALRRLDEQARVEDGLEEIEQRRNAADEALEKHDAALSEAKTARQEVFERLERMDQGEDDAYRRIVAFLASELDRDDVRALRREAIATPFPDDDVVVARLLDLEAEREQLAKTVEDMKEAVRGNRERVRELERFLKDFADRRLDVPGSGFPDGDLVSTMITQFLRGAIASHVLWRVLEGQRSASGRHSNPTFGSGGFGRGSPWTGGGWPGRTGGSVNRSSGSKPPVFAPPSSGGMKRGGFRTGGTISRGGFRTGGKKR